MRRRSAGRPGGQRSGSTRERLGSSDLALWRARARASREITGFAVCRLLLQRGARIHRARSYSHYVETFVAAACFVGFGWHTGCHTGALLSRASTRQRIGGTHS